MMDDEACAGKETSQARKKLPHIEGSPARLRAVHLHHHLSIFKTTLGGEAREEHGNHETRGQNEEKNTRFRLSQSIRVRGFTGEE